MSDPKDLSTAATAAMDDDAAASSTAAPASASAAAAFAVETSPNDDRPHVHLTLPNGLSVLLVSDPTAERSAAAVDVRVGHLSDPDDVPGLAHFLEHMLFLGTEKYPDENSYNKYLNEHGGSSNAYTDMESTNYYFNVDSDHLDGALDRFAQFFIAPLFTASTTERELKAVDSEHQKNLQNDYWRAFQLAKNLVRVIHDENNDGDCDAAATPVHPFAKFGSGNAKTLSDDPKARGIDVREKLLDFHSKHYSANVMKLVVLGKESPEELEALVREKFSAVARKDGVEPPVFPGNPYGQPGSLRKSVRVVPVRDVRTLDISFPMRETASLYRSKPTRYIGHLLGHESKGSVLSYLKEKGWANGLSAGESRSCTDWSAFDLQVDLTDVGLEHVEEVVEVVFAYLDMMRRKGPIEWVYEETRRVAECTFRFLSKRQPIDYVNHLAGTMQLYPPEYAVSGPYCFFGAFVPEDVTELVETYMHPRNMILQVTSRKFTEGEDEPNPKLKKEYWYGTEHSVENVSDELLLRLEAATVTSLGLEKDIVFPEPNDMIASDFDIRVVEGAPEDEPRLLISDDETRGDDGASDADATTPAEPLSPRMRLWYKPDNVFKLPKANVMANLTSPAVSESPLGFVCAELYASMLTEKSNEFAYLASVAGLHCNFSAHGAGVTIGLSGYNHKMNALMRRIMDDLVDLFPSSPKIDDGEGREKDARRELFDRLKDKLTKQYTNFLYLQPYQHAFAAADLVLESRAWDIHAKIDAMKKVTLEDVFDFARRFHSQHRLEMLIHGNCSPGEATEIAHTIYDRLNAGVKYGSSIDAGTESRAVKLERGRECAYRFPEYNPEETNGCLCTVLQMGPIELETNAVLAFVSHLIKEPAFNELRTNEQLGYIVHNSIHTSGDNIKGLLLLIQSDGYSPIHLDNRVEEFLTRFRTKLVEMEDKDFQTNIDAVVKMFQEKNKNLGEESTKYWSVITTRSYNFKKLQLIGDIVSTITKAQTVEFFDKYLAKEGPERRKMSVQVYSKEHAQEMTSGAESGDAGEKLDVLGSEDEVVEYKRTSNLWNLPKRVNIDNMKMPHTK